MRPSAAQHACMSAPRRLGSSLQHCLVVMQAGLRLRGGVGWQRCLELLLGLQLSPAVNVMRGISLCLPRIPLPTPNSDVDSLLRPAAGVHSFWLL